VEYRKALRRKREVAEARISKDLHEQLLSKDHTSFWRTWKNKVSSKRLAAEIVDGYTQPADIANAFAVNFGNAYTPNSIARNDDLKAEFETRLSHYCPVTSGKFISLELVDRCWSVMKLAKAAGIDNIETEHLRHAHRKLSVLLSVLFNCMVTALICRDGFEASMFEAKASVVSSRPRPVVFEVNEKRYVQGRSILLPLDVNIFS